MTTAAIVAQNTTWLENIPNPSLAITKTQLKTAADIRNTSQGVAAVDVHRAWSTDALTTRSAKGQGRILFIFDLDEGIKNHGSAVIKIHLVRLHVRLVSRLVWILDASKHTQNLHYLENYLKLPKKFNTFFSWLVMLVQKWNLQHNLN